MWMMHLEERKSFQKLFIMNEYQNYKIIENDLTEEEKSDTLGIQIDSK